jgi:hypothetical protein
LGSELARIHGPLYITTDPKEQGNVDTVLRKAHGGHVTRYRPKIGVHGASTRVCARDPGGCSANLRSFLAFLKTKVSHAPEGNTGH